MGDLLSVSLRAALRTLHLYVGLVASPFVLVYAISTLALNHPAGLTAAPTTPRQARVQIADPAGDSLALARDVARQLDVSGEIMFVRRDLKTGELEIPVQHAGRRSTIEVDLATGKARVESKPGSILQSLIFFHKAPGPHVVAMRGNSPAVALWRWVADGAVLAIVFLVATGVWLWTALRAERRFGMVCLFGGASVFAVLVAGLVL